MAHNDPFYKMNEYRRITEFVTPLEDGWRKQGYQATFSSHHLAPLQLGSDRRVRQILGEMVAAGLLRAVYDTRGRKTWQTIRKS